MKYVAGEGFIVGDSNCKLTTAIYGNVTNSTGSIIPLIWNFIKKDETLSLYGVEMTRFLLDVEEAIDLIMKSPFYEGCNIIPIAKSFKVKDLFDIYRKKFGLKYVITEPRTGEKIHEIMASSEEVRRMELVRRDNIYLLHPQKDINKVSFENNEYSSKDHCLTRSQLYDYLESKNFYQP